MESTPAVADGINTSKINSIERQNSLDQHLQNRPDKQDLKNRHILLDTNAAPYVEAYLTALLIYSHYVLMFCNLIHYHAGSDRAIELCKPSSTSSGASA